MENMIGGEICLHQDYNTTNMFFEGDLHHVHQEGALGTHIICVVALAEDLYSAFVLDLGMVACFLALYDTMFDVKKT
jgi:hypothetical protein